MGRLPYTYALVFISIFSVACIAESLSNNTSPTYTPYPTYTPAPAQIIEVTPTPGPWVCLKGKFQVSDETGGQWIIGDKMLCAPEWKISNLYGPNIDAHEGPIHFSDFIPKELIE